MSAEDSPSRTTTETKAARIYFPELDGLRFLAFLLVFFHHREWYPLPGFSILHEMGWIGVDLFFALSAFLFTRLLSAEYAQYQSISIYRFYLRRIFRIWPLYFFIILLSVLFFLYRDDHHLSEIDSFRWIGLVTFTENFFNAFHGYNSLPFISPMWTISYEEQFYLFIPFLILFLSRAEKKQRLVFTTLILLALVLVRIWLVKAELPSPALWVLPLSHFEAIIFGIFIGFGALDKFTLKVRSYIWFLVAIACLYVIPMCPPVNKNTQGVALTFLLIGVFSASLLIAVRNSAYLRTLFSHPVLVFLGKRSYGLYVYHQLSNALLDPLMKAFTFLPYTPWGTFAYSLVMTIVIACLSYQFLEKPFLKIKQRFELVRSRPI